MPSVHTSVVPSEDFEKRFMHLVDTDASRALARIVAGNTDNWPGRLRSAWARFILDFLDIIEKRIISISQIQKAVFFLPDVDKSPVDRR